MTIPRGDRRFYLAGHTIMLAGRFVDGESISHRVATADDLALLNDFGRRVLATGSPWDVSAQHWWYRRATRAAQGQLCAS